jgi:hypothetical protein
MATVLVSSTDRTPSGSKRSRSPPDREIKEVVMSLGPGTLPYSSLPDLAPGDELQITAELELTTDAPIAKWAVKKPYSYDPKIRAQLLLASDPDATEPERGRAKRLTPLRNETCVNAQHHHRLVFEPLSYVIPAWGLGWKGDSYLNLVLSAHYPSAIADEVLLVGQNEAPVRKGAPATVKGNQGRLNVVRYRGAPKPRGRVLTTKQALAAEVPIVKGQPVVVYSLALADLEQDDQLVLEASLKTTNPYHYPARVSAGVFVTDSPSATELSKGARDLVPFHGEIGKSNGTNILPKQSYVARKFGTLRVLNDVPGPLYANLVVLTGDPDHRSGSGDAVDVDAGGYVRIRRLHSRVTG